MFVFPYVYKKKKTRYKHFTSKEKMKNVEKIWLREDGGGPRGNNTFRPRFPSKYSYFLLTSFFYDYARFQILLFWTKTI